MDNGAGVMKTEKGNWGRFGNRITRGEGGDRGQS